MTGRGDSEPVGKGDRVKDQKLAPYSHTSQLIHPSSHEEPQSCIIPVYDDSTTSRYRGTRAPGGQRAWQKPPGNLPSLGLIPAVPAVTLRGAWSNISDVHGLVHSPSH